MEIVKSIDQYNSLLDEAKKKNHLSISNSLFMKQDILDLTASRNLFYKNVSSGILFIKKHRGCNYLYYFLDDTKELHLDGFDGNLMIEIIDRMKLNRSAKQLDFWQRNGFYKYATNYEMIKTNTDIVQSVTPQEEPFTIKFALVDYVDQILNLWRSNLCELIMPLPSKQELISMINGGSVVCVLNDEDHIIGALQLESNYGRCLLSHIVIHPDYRGMGLATRMIHHCFSEIPTQKFYLWVNQENKNAQRLYEYLGFKYSQKISIQLIKKMEAI